MLVAQSACVPSFQLVAPVSDGSLRIAFCACYALDVWHAQRFPFLTQLLFNEDGSKYQQLDILNDDFTLNEEKLAAVGLPWYAASQLLYKISRTMYIGAAITHFLLWHGKTVYNLVWTDRVRAFIWFFF